MHHIADDNTLDTSKRPSKCWWVLRTSQNYTFYKAWRSITVFILLETMLRWLNAVHIFTFPLLYCMFHPTNSAHTCTLSWHCWLPTLRNYCIYTSSKRALHVLCVHDSVAHLRICYVGNHSMKPHNYHESPLWYCTSYNPVTIKRLHYNNKPQNAAHWTLMFGTSIFCLG